MGKVKESLLTTDDLYINSGGTRWVDYRPASVMELLLKLKILNKDVISNLLLRQVINHHEYRAFSYYLETGRILGDDKDENGVERF